MWIYLRHYINLVILSSTILPTGAFRNVGSFTLDWNTQQYKCWISQYITFALLATLQSINLFWLWFILRIAYNAIKAKEGEEAKDVRSEDEEDGEEEEKEREEQRRRDERRMLEQTKGQGNGHAGVNGKVNTPEGHESYRDAVVEGKKER